MEIVSACATRAQRQAQAITANNQSAIQQLRACADAVRHSPEYAVIGPHMNLHGGPTLEQMTDNTFATDKEIQAIFLTHPKVRACEEAFLHQIAQTTPSIVPIYTKFIAANDDLLVDLVQKKITWGTLARTQMDRGPELEAELAAEYQRINEGLYQENEAELAQRQAAASAMAQYYQQQQMIDALNRPVITSCTKFGYPTNCVSQ
jgi:hypothetical protein